MNREEKKDLEIRLKRAESKCLRWSLTLRDYGHQIEGIDKEIEALEEKRIKLEEDLEMAPVRLAEAQAEFMKYKQKEDETALEPTKKRVMRAREELGKLLKAVEAGELELTEEQMDLLRTAKAELRL